MRQFFVGRIAVFVFINAPNFLCAKLFYAAEFFLRAENCQNQIVVRKNLCIWNMCSLPLFKVRDKKNYIFLLNNVLQIMLY